MRKTIWLQTYGCQMNERDSEEVLGMLMAQGYEIAEHSERADVILLNTCSVRRHAEERAFGKMGELSELKRQRPELILGIIGCMTKVHRENIFKRLPLVDLVAGPAELYDLPYLLAEIQERRQKLEVGSWKLEVGTNKSNLQPPISNFQGNSIRVIAVDRQFRPLNKRPVGDYRAAGISAFVTIMEGCDKSCSYCIVPTTRGQEISRPVGEIISEINALVAAGYKEITLLGQNVNSYGKRFPDGSGYRGPLGRLRMLGENPNALLDFPQLLRRIDTELQGLAPRGEASESRAQRAGGERLLSRGYLSDRAPNGRGVGGRFADGAAPGASLRASEPPGCSSARLRFTTSHPFDANERLFAAMRECESVCEALHLPVQSGSNRILRAMRRGYTAEAYLKKIELLRREVPDISLSTDIIVGFPGETEEDFRASERLMREICFDNAYIFKYSPRPATFAAAKEDDVAQALKEERNQRLLSLQREISSKRHQALVGRQLEILVEDRGNFGGQWFGRTRGNHGVIIDSPEDLLGHRVQARITRGSEHTLFGELACSGSLL